MKKQNVFYAVYDKHGKVVAIAKDKTTALQEALKTSNHRWSIPTLQKDWKYLESDGYRVAKIKIPPYKEVK